MQLARLAIASTHIIVMLHLDGSPIGQRPKTKPVYINEINVPWFRHYVAIVCALLEYAFRTDLIEELLLLNLTLIVLRVVIRTCILDDLRRRHHERCHQPPARRHPGAEKAV
jgi:hypothetical protein